MNPMLWKLNPVFRIIALLLGLLILGLFMSDPRPEGADAVVFLLMGSILSGLGVWQLWRFGLRWVPLE